MLGSDEFGIFEGNQLCKVDQLIDGTIATEELDQLALLLTPDPFENLHHLLRLDPQHL